MSQDEDELGWLLELDLPLPDTGEKLTIPEPSPADLDDEVINEPLSVTKPPQMIGYVTASGSSMQRAMPKLSELRFDSHRLTRYTPAEWAAKLAMLTHDMKNVLTQTEFRGLQASLGTRHAVLGRRMMLVTLPEVPPSDAETLATHLHYAPIGSTTYAGVETGQVELEDALQHLGWVISVHYVWVPAAHLTAYEREVMKHLVGIMQWGGELVAIRKIKQRLAEVY